MNRNTTGRMPGTPRSRRSGIILVIIGILVSGPGAQASPEARDSARAVVLEFHRFADEQRADQLEKILHPEFRVWAQVKGSPEVIRLSRTAYLDKIRSREFGGDPRRVKIVSVEIHGGLALVRATSRGARAAFTSSYHLVREAEGWQLTNDMAEVEFLK